jgi:hypothetical protein
MFDSMTIDHGAGKRITRVAIPDTRRGVRWVECGWCRQEATGKVAPKGCVLCADHNLIRMETL